MLVSISHTIIECSLCDLSRKMEKLSLSDGNRSMDSCSNDLDESNDHYIESRIKSLGFKPQKENIFSNLLPYSQNLDEDSQNLLKDIKGNLGRCLLLKEFEPGCLIWTSRLSRYIEMFGLKFSKEDHIAIIKLFYELLTIPKLEPLLVERFAIDLSLLLRKKELIPKEDLVLPWRPLYNVFEPLCNSSNSSLGMYRYPPYVENALSDVVKYARVYFEPSATQEMLDLWRPQLCPFDSIELQRTMGFLDGFLPTLHLPHETGLGYELWFNEFMDFWKTCHNSPPWESSMMGLMSRVASHNIGRINWEPHMSMMYTRILRSFILPVNYKKMKINKNLKLSTSTTAMWIMATLGGGSSSQDYLSRMMKVIEPYFHPANTGLWLTRLREFLRKLPYYFMQRLSLERNHKPDSWLPQTPERARLTEDDITRFVESMAPAAHLAVYSRVISEVSFSLKSLAIMRPEIIIPPIIESMYNTLDSLTEPHKYTAAMMALVSVARPMVEANDYKAGPTHVIPLLMAVLPGIDPNDIRKCFITFQFISTFVSLIPVVDCSGASEYWKDLTEEEEELCAATSQFEDFVMELLDRVFLLVDNSTLESTRLEESETNKPQRSRMESMAESVIVSSINVLLYQLSPQIFKSALRKLFTYITSRIFETTVSGKCVALICKAFAKVRPEETMKLLVPHICQTILSLAEHEDIKKEEKLDNEIMYNLLLLSEVVHGNCNPETLLIYGEMIEKVLDLTLHVRHIEAYSLAFKVLNNMFITNSTTRPKEFKSSNEDYGKHVSEFLAIREWGKSYQIRDVKIEWFVPGAANIAYAQHLIEKYLEPELETVRSYTVGKLEITREELHCTLGIIGACLGCGRILPLWDEPPCYSEESCSERKSFCAKSCFAPSVTMSNGSNVRSAVASVMTRLQAKLFDSAEDDIKSFRYLAIIWGGLLLNLLPPMNEFEAQSKVLHMGKQLNENKLLGRRRHTRTIVVNQAYQQHECIVLCTVLQPTATHKDIFQRLIELASSRYSEVRQMAQGRLNSACYLMSKESLMVPKLVELLKQDSNLHHEQFKGSLYMLLGPKDKPLVTSRKWNVIGEIWPALVRSQPSEKPSVINLLSMISETIKKQFATITIHLELGHKTEDVARLLWHSSVPIPDLPIPSAEEISAGEERLAKRNEKHKADYLQLLDDLLSAINSNLHWRNHSLALGFLRDLVHPDCNYPPNVIKNILQTLIHDNIEFRKTAIRCTVFVLKQQKRAHKYKSVRVEESSGSTVLYGERDDNQWLQYKSATAPKSQQAWDEPRYLHKNNIGYYSWPKEVKVYSPNSEQPLLDRKRDELTAGELEVDDFFSDPQKIKKLVDFLSLEEKKGKDKFNGTRFLLFKGLFRNHGDKYVSLFKPHLERLIADKQESNQRCAAEIMTGMMRGSKHWPYEKVRKLWDLLIPLLETAFTNLTVETVSDWSVLAATASEHRDPNRNHWLLEFLMIDPLRQDSSFIDCGRLCALQGAVNQQSWRLTEIFLRLIEYLTPKLSHPYQLLRERIGSVLTNIFAPDLPTPGGRRTRGPQLSQFVASVLPQLDCLYTLSEVPASNKDAGSSQMDVDFQSPPLEEREKNNAICLLKTMLKWITNSLVRADYSAIPEFYSFLPLVFLMESYEADDELKKVCSSMLAAMAQSMTLPEFVPSALAAIQEVSKMDSWWCRASGLEFFQVYIFHNMATIASQEAWVSQVNSLVLKLLKDDRVEVREQAGQMLSGLIHCDFVGDRRQLMNELSKLTRAKKKSGSNEISKRHAGVLGLCAFISANPYDVVDPVPDIFPLLGSHLNDPQPIPSSIRKTLGDFKRTHHDNWEQHKLKFSEEQLAVLTDLIVPPSYYA